VTEGCVKVNGEVVLVPQHQVRATADRVRLCAPGIRQVTCMLISWGHRHAASWCSVASSRQGGCALACAKSW
jgi:hypothetical protein